MKNRSDSMPTDARRPLALAGAALAFSGLVFVASPARGAPQNALGDGRGLEHSSGSGRVLDRNPQSGSGGSNTPGIQEDLRTRNLVVTGNVAGGRGFRGNVNYTADRDFRGATSDDTSYDFRAGSAFSDPRIARAGSMGDSLNLARNYGTVEYGRSAVRGALIGSDVNGTRLVFDQTAARMLTPEARQATMELSTVASVTQADGQRVRVTTNGFRGVSAIPEVDAVDRMNLGLYDTAQLKHELRQGKIDKDLKALDYRSPLQPRPSTPGGGAESRTDDAPGAGSTRIEPGRIDTGIKTMDTILSEVERKIQGRTAPTPRGADRDAAQPRGAEGAGRTDGGPALTPEEEARQKFLKELDEIRDEMRGRAPAGSTEPGDGTKGAATVPTAGEAEPISVDAAATGTARTPEREKMLNELVATLKHGQTVSSVSENTVARVQEILASGESAMSRQAYFLAEQHFNTALALTPNNPLAKLGLANAQLGAGLLASSAISLRELYISNPELIDATIAPALLPPRERMQSILEKLASTPVDGRNAGDVGLLRAYVGRQLGDRSAMEQGLATLESASAGDATLATLLRGIWLGAPAAAPSEPAAPSAPPAPSAPAAP